MCRRILCAVPVITIVAAASLWLASPVWAQDFHDPVMDPDPVMDGVGMQTFFLNFGGFGFPLFFDPSWLTGQAPEDGQWAPGPAWAPDTGAWYTGDQASGFGQHTVGDAPTGPSYLWAAVYGVVDRGDPGDDVLAGGDGDDVLLGGGGDDTVSGAPGLIDGTKEDTDGDPTTGLQRRPGRTTPSSTVLKRGYSAAEALWAWRRYGTDGYRAPSESGAEYDIFGRGGPGNDVIVGGGGDDTVSGGANGSGASDETTDPGAEVGGMDVRASGEAKAGAQASPGAGAEGKAPIGPPGTKSGDTPAPPPADAPTGGDPSSAKPGGGGPFSVKASGHASAGAEADPGQTAGYDAGKLPLPKADAQDKTGKAAGPMSTTPKGQVKTKHLWKSAPVGNSVSLKNGQLVFGTAGLVGAGGPTPQQMANRFVKSTGVQVVKTGGPGKGKQGKDDDSDDYAKYLKWIHSLTWKPLPDVDTPAKKREVFDDLRAQVSQAQAALPGALETAGEQLKRAEEIAGEKWIIDHARTTYRLAVAAIREGWNVFGMIDAFLQGASNAPDNYTVRIDQGTGEGTTYTRTFITNNTNGQTLTIEDKKTTAKDGSTTHSVTMNLGQPTK